MQEIKLAMAAINDLLNIEVFGKRNLDALDKIYTAEARILPPGGPMISGRGNIKTFWSNRIEALSASSVAIDTIEVMPAGDGAIEIGCATLTAVPAGQATVRTQVKYLVYWQREDGQWKWHVDIWNQIC
ncbi:MAG: nuclear transport factor 2 family protein [Acidobacteriota bacterium]|nr:nuclear transport factor 2 family protein [Acidobacteriota bacterium]